MEDGATKRDHLRAAAAATGRPDPALVSRPPAGTEQVWEVFCALSRQGRSAGMGPSPIPPSEIEAWQRLQGVRLTSWEVDCIAALDVAVMAAHAELQPKASKE